MYANFPRYKRFINFMFGFLKRQSSTRMLKILTCSSLETKASK